MDNQNNSNLPNLDPNPGPTPPSQPEPSFSDPVQPTSPWSLPPQPQGAFTQSNPPPDPLQSPSAATESFGSGDTWPPVSQPTQPIPDTSSGWPTPPSVTTQPSAWPAPVESAPVESTTPFSTPGLTDIPSQPQSAPQSIPNQLAPEPTSTWTPSSTPIAPEQPQTAQPEPILQETTPLPPTPTFTPPSYVPPPQPAAPETNQSSLDNPWGAPTQPPAIDSSFAPAEPSWMNTNPTESAPTDLSHLISSNSPTETSAPSEIIPSTAGATLQMPDLTTEAHKGIPIWAIGLGVGLLLLVIGASAYFILGIGQPSKPTTSLPATIQTAEKTPVPVAVPTSQPTAQPVASESTNFGNLQNSRNTPQATSAAEVLRQRQQGR